MNSFYLLFGLVVIAIIVGIIEFRLHQKRIYSIPIRIHINGTRGKSSVTRLIGAGLREGGISCITKVTGTFPRLILEDGSETQIYRKSSANIIEQLAIAKFAAERKVKALVVECMALQPQYQSITEHMMIHSNISVMTNIRIDHTDVMGHTLNEIADTLCRTIPKNEILFTTENIIPEKIIGIATKRGTKTYCIDEKAVTQEEMKGFSYIEHCENVALALAVCKHLGIEKGVALQGMYKTFPDAGVLTRHRVIAFQKEMVFYNAFAANDPDSTLLVWQKIGRDIGFEGKRIVLLNTRQDRLYRAQQLVEMVSKKIDKEFDYLMLIGQSVEVVESAAVSCGVPKKKIVPVGWTTPEDVFETILSLTEKTSTTVAIGNMGGMGADTVDYFKNRSS